VLERRRRADNHRARDAPAALSAVRSTRTLDISVMLGLYLLFLVLGIACLVGGLFITRQTWRPDIEPFGRRSRMFQIALHPERYAKPDRLTAIRLLNLIGASFVLLAVAVIGFDIYRSLPSGI